jgi:hypothetical protein
MLGILGPKELDRDGPGQHLVLGTPDLADATGGDLIDQPVPASQQGSYVSHDNLTLSGNRR